MSKSPSPHELMQKHASLIMEAVPWAKTLGFQVLEVGQGSATARVAWREDLIGDPDTGVIAGGVITALLDNLCGVAVGAALKEVRSMATLDLRIDYMRPATRGLEIFAHAECYHLTRSVAFTRASAYHGDNETVIATAAGTFALNDPARWAGGSLARAVKAEGESS